MTNYGLKYSDGKFGFSVQKQIYESLGGTKEQDLRKSTFKRPYVGANGICPHAYV
ncbi:MAG: GUN4 domain-containing protein, partial [Trichodesmium sp. St17_bin3_1_1]|nr:GUN4 domain-containing protein [Trichodesmium sp. St17_bin3_1_1]